VDEGYTGRNADETTEEKPVPLVAEKDFSRYPEADDREDGNDVVTKVQGCHRLLLAVLFCKEGHRCEANYGREDAEGPKNQSKHDPLDPDRDGIDRDAEDHGADVFGGHRLEEVRTTTGAVADVVAYKVRDHRGVSRVIL